LIGQQATTGSPSGARFVFSAEYRAQSLSRPANRDASKLLTNESESPLMVIGWRPHKRTDDPVGEAVSFAPLPAALVCRGTARLLFGPRTMVE
jgi:hypothetical protein